MPVLAECKRRVRARRRPIPRILVDARDQADLWSAHVTCSMTQAVLQMFRRRISTAEAIAFAKLLPIGLRALFVTDCTVDKPRRDFSDPESLIAEVRALRPDHNFSPDDANSCVARALRRQIDEEAFDALLATLPPAAVEFWSA